MLGDSIGFCCAFVDYVLYRWWVCRERNSYSGVVGLGSLAAVVVEIRGSGWYHRKYDE